MPKSSNGSSWGRSASGKHSKGKRSSVSSGFGRLLLGVLIGICLSIGSVVAYFYAGRPPVAVADKPALWEHLAETTSVHRRVAAEVKQPPFPANEDVFEAAARTYREQCAMCHGVPGREAAVGRQMLPHAQQFFGRDRKSTGTKSAGELFWPTAFGVRRSGMPAYNRTLSNVQLWQLALLLHSANDELPDPVSHLLIAEPPPSQPQTEPQGQGVSVPLRRPTRGGQGRLRDTGHLAPAERPESRF